MLGEAAADGELAPALAHIGETQNRVDEIVVRRQLERVHAGVAERGVELGLALLGRRLEPPAKSAVVRVDENLLTGLGILHDEHPQIRQLHFQRIVKAHGDDVVPLREMSERLRPAGRADEVRDDENQRAPRRHRIGGAQQLAEIGGAGLCARRTVLHHVEEVQHLTPAASRRDDRVDAIPVEQRRRRDCRGASGCGRARPRTRSTPPVSSCRANRNRPTRSSRAGTRRRLRAPRCTRGRRAR